MLLKVKKNNEIRYMLALSDTQFEFFLIKLCGTMISRGRKDYAMRMYDTILFNFKKHFKKDPFLDLRLSIDNLIPILSSRQKKVGKVYHSVPKLATGNRRFVIMLDWIIRKQKDKSNVMGFKINDISKNLIDAVYNKGLLMNLKKQHLASSLAGKHLLYRNRRRVSRFFRKSFLRFRKKMQKKKANKKFYSSIGRPKYSRRRWDYLRKQKKLFIYSDLVH